MSNSAQFLTSDVGHHSADATRESLIREVRRGLLWRPRSLSPWILYDARGSLLFELITNLPEYYPTRTERNIFASFS
jgi:L-histidine N-alpha-methyltransferase